MRHKRSHSALNGILCHKEVESAGAAMGWGVRTGISVSLWYFYDLFVQFGEMHIVAQGEDTYHLLGAMMDVLLCDSICWNSGNKFIQNVNHKEDVSFIW